MGLINWKNSYSVGVKIIDEQHKKLFSLLNKLYTQITKLQSNNLLNETLQELADYVDMHFTTEEKYFDEFNYAENKPHIAEHKDYVKKIKEFQQKFREGKIFLTYEVVDFLENWILNHVTGTDKLYTKCFNDNGLY